MKEVSKELFYNWVVDIYLKTGQGLSGKIILSKVSREPLDALVAEGKLKTIKEHYSYFPDEEWICLTGVYCVEEEKQKGGVHTRALEFIRRYLGMPRDSVNDQKVDEYFVSNPDKKAEYEQWYNEWLQTNKEILEKSFQVQKMEIPDEPSKLTLNKDLANYIKECNWYIDNYSVSDALSNVTRRIFLHKELVDLLKIVVQKRNSDTDKIELEKNESELKMNEKLKRMLQNARNMNVQEYFDRYEL